MGKDKGKPPNTPSDSTKSPEPNDGVGYGKPPKHSRFKPGRSGNSKGRPRGARGRKAIVDKTAYEMHWVTERGKRRRVSTHEFVLWTIRNKSIEGDLKAFRALHKLLEKYGPQESIGQVGFLAVREHMSIEEWSKIAKVQQQESKKRMRELYDDHIKPEPED